ncbi:MAG TPA: hypothetical protein VME70_12585 [Mycobacteriales bacterium]|nr:hypothetical protein [Mycobacteriales bacterium]
MAEPRSSHSFRLPDGTRSVQSVWVWRAFLLMSLVAFGLCLTFVTNGWLLYASAWGVIGAGWFAISMWLWRKHVREDDAAWQAARAKGRAA